MKRHSVISLASLTCAIFLVVIHSSFKVETRERFQTSYYWYRVNSAGQMDASSMQFSGIPQTKAYAEVYDGCYGAGRDCLRGFLIPLVNFPSSAQGNEKTIRGI